MAESAFLDSMRWWRQALASLQDDSCPAVRQGVCQVRHDDHSQTIPTCTLGAITVCWPLPALTSVPWSGVLCQALVSLFKGQNDHVLSKLPEIMAFILNKTQVRATRPRPHTPRRVCCCSCLSSSS